MDEDLAIAAEITPDEWGTFTLLKTEIDNDNMYDLNKVFDEAERQGCIVSYEQHSHLFSTTIEKLKVVGPARLVRLIDIAMHK